VRAVSFQADFGATTFTIWIDRKTKLPVRINSTLGTAAESMQMTMRDFVFNAPAEEALFSIEARISCRNCPQSRRLS
jgi:hypothetical protein